MLIGLLLGAGDVRASDVPAAPPPSWRELLVNAVMTVVATAVPILTAYAVAFIRAHVQNAAVKAGLEEAATHAETAVLNEMQTRIRPALKSIADGSPVGEVARTTLQDAKTDAVLYVRSMLSPRALTALTKSLGSDAALSEFLDRTVEAKVLSAKIACGGGTPKGPQP
jgi:hypothetical protein